jgi:multidrug efflux pump subunit AcrB
VVDENRSRSHETPRNAVIGGMISSLIHVLIVTPVIFMWL